MITSLILNLLEKKYFKKKKFIQEFEKETENCRHLYKEEYGLEDIKIEIKIKIIIDNFLRYFGSI